MKESKRIILEQQQNDINKKMTMEQTFEDNYDPNTPQWNTAKISIKENTAEKGTLFIQSFISAIKPALILSGIILIIILIKVC